MDLKEQMEREKKPFIKDGKPVIYPIVGDVFVFRDNSGVVYLNGTRPQVDKAIMSGELEGVVKSCQDSCQDEVIFPVIELQNGVPVVSAVHHGGKASCYHYFNTAHNLEATVYKLEEGKK